MNAGTGVVATPDPPGDPALTPEPEPALTPQPDAPTRPGWTSLDSLIVAWLILAAALILWRSWWRIPRESLPPSAAPIDPSHPGHEPNRDIALILIAGALIIWLSQIVGYSTLLSLTSVVATESDHESVGVSSAKAIGMLGQYLGAGLAIAFILSAMPPIRSALTRDWKPIAIPIGFLAMILAYPLCAATGALVEWIRQFLSESAVDPLAHQTLRALVDAQPTLWWWLTLLGAALGAPIIEELIYRGFLQNGLQRLMRSPWPAILTTSVVFTVIHAGAVEPRAMPVLFVLSVSLGVVYARTGRILAPIAMHTAFNAANIALALMQHSAA